MTKAEKVKKIKLASKRVSREISVFAKQGTIFAGMANEGYSGGYYDALQDVLLLLNDIIPNRRHYWWHEDDK